MPTYSLLHVVTTQVITQQQRKDRAMSAASEIKGLLKVHALLPTPLF
jgi:hypothetical protein